MKPLIKRCKECCEHDSNLLIEKYGEDLLFSKFKHAHETR